jgi:putative two-component system response regulator
MIHMNIWYIFCFPFLLLNQGGMMQKGNILIVDDEMGPRESLRMILKPFYNVHIAESGAKAIEVVREKEIDLVTLDLKMPGIQGVDVLREIKDIRHDIGVIIITGYGTLKSAIDGIRLGASDYLIKPFNITEIVSAVHQAMERKKDIDSFRSFLLTLQDQISHGPVHEKLDEYLKKSNDLIGRTGGIEWPVLDKEKRHFQNESLQFARVLIESLEGQNSYTDGHSRRIHLLTSLLANSVGLDKHELHDLETASFLHDVGLLGNNSTEERTSGKTHPKTSAELVSLLGVSKEVIEAIRYHHEPYNAKGRPGSPSNLHVSMLARMICLAEFFDNLIVGSIGRPPLSPKETILQLQQESGRLLDPELVQHFIKIIEKEGSSLLQKQKSK